MKQMVRIKGSWSSLVLDIVGEWRCIYSLEIVYIYETIYFYFFEKRMFKIRKQKCYFLSNIYKFLQHFCSKIEGICSMWLQEFICCLLCIFFLFVFSEYFIFEFMLSDLFSLLVLENVSILSGYHIWKIKKNFSNVVSRTLNVLNCWTYFTIESFQISVQYPHSFFNMQ